MYHHQPSKAPSPYSSVAQGATYRVAIIWPLLTAYTWWDSHACVGSGAEECLPLTLSRVDLVCSSAQEPSRVEGRSPFRQTRSRDRKPACSPFCQCSQVQSCQQTRISYCEVAFPEFFTCVLQRLIVFILSNASSLNGLMVHKHPVYKRMPKLIHHKLINTLTYRPRF